MKRASDCRCWICDGASDVMTSFRGAALGAPGAGCCSWRDSCAETEPSTEAATRVPSSGGPRCGTLRERISGPGGQPRTRAGERCDRRFRRDLTSMPLGVRRLPAPAADLSGVFGFGGREPLSPRTSPTCFEDLADFFFATFAPCGALRLTAIGFSLGKLGQSVSSTARVYSITPPLTGPIRGRRHELEHVVDA